MTAKKNSALDIAIIGMSGSFPQSENIETFWESLCEGKELISRYGEEELLKFGMDKESISSENYVGVSAPMKKRTTFDTTFFGYTAEEAKGMDPQIRKFHEHTWSAFENAGCDPSTYSGKIGMFAAADENLNWKAARLMEQYLSGNMSAFEQLSNKNFISTLVAHKLNLRGPAYTIDTACSSSLVNVHLACRALLMKECEMAVAGAVRIDTTGKIGYEYKEGMVLSKDGACKPFSSEASGTVSGEGVGVVILKRRADAERDRDHIYAVIKATAANNDGAGKIGFTAPSIDGQKDCIQKACRQGKIEPQSISYIETHGTGTKLGDPIEFESLSEVFEGCSDITLGAVKSNIGHLDCAAGIAGLIKTSLVLKHRMIPPVPYFQAPNPEIDWKNGPFEINTQLKKLTGEAPLRAGVSSFGIGGTNVHVVLEEVLNPKSSDLGFTGILPLSAMTEEVLKVMIQKCEQALQKNKLSLKDACYTLQTGRKHFSHRVALSVQDGNINFTQAKQQIHTVNRLPEVQFCFDGLPNYQMGIGSSIYNHHLKQLIEGQEDHPEMHLFASGVAMGQTLKDFGILPISVVGKGKGAFVAAVLENQMEFETGWNLLKNNSEFSLPQEKIHEGIILQLSGVSGEASLNLCEDRNTYNGFLKTLAFGWQRGCEVNWNLLDENKDAYKVPLPGYAFEEFEFPVNVSIEEQIKRRLTHAASDSEFIYSPVWKQVPKNLTPKTSYSWKMVLSDGSERSLKLVQQYRDRGEQVFELLRGEQNRIIGADQFEVKDIDDTLLPFFEGKLNGSGILIHLWEGKEGYFSLLQAVRLLAKHQTLEVNVVGSGTARVMPGDQINPIQALLVAAVKTIRHEFLKVKSRFVDVSQQTQSIHTLLDVLDSEISKDYIAVREDFIYEQTFDKVALDESSVITPESWYIITGANGGIGGVLALHLARKYRAKLVLVGRSEINSKLETELQKVQTTYHYIASDLTENIQESIQTRIGTEELGGVIHTAGIGDYSGVIQGRDQKDCEAVFQAKVTGTQKLLESIRELRPGFLMLCSSKASVLAPFGQVGYTAANRFMDHFALAVQEEFPVISIGWDTWKEVGMALEATQKYTVAEQNLIFKNALSNAEGIACFEKALSSGLNWLVVSKKDLKTCIQEEDEKLENVSVESDQFPMRSRFITGTEYTSPETETENVITTIWSEILGVREIGIDDDFFELGGDSLKAMNIAMEMTNQCGVEIIFNDLFDYATVRELAAEIEIMKGMNQITEDTEIMNEESTTIII